MRIVRSVACGVALVGLMALPALASTEGAGAAPLPVLKKASRLDCDAGRYPLTPAKYGREGWVELAYTIRADGSVGDIRVLDSSSPGVFEAAAIKRIESCRYQPATLDGRPVEAKTEAVTFFVHESASLGGEGRAIGRHAGMLRGIDEALEKGDLADVHRRIEQMRAVSTLNLYEYAHLFSREGAYHLARNDLPAARRAFQRALMGGKENMEPDLYSIRLRNLLATELQMGLAGAALETREKLLGNRGRLKDDDPVLQAAAKLSDLVASGAPIAVDAKLADPCQGEGTCAEPATWTYTPARKTISFHNVSGEVREVAAECETNRSAGPITEGAQWVIPAHWGTCTVSATGAPGASFRLVEH